MSERELDLVFTAPWGRAAVIASIALALATLVLSAWSGRRLKVAPAAALLALRTLATLCALIVLLKPAVRVRQVRRPPGRIAVLVDASQSMTVRDGEDGRSRWQRAQAALLAARPQIARWRRDHALDWFTFSSALEPAGEIPPGAPAGATTLIADALEAASARGGDDLGGVLLVSDGADHGRLAARPQKEAARLAARLAVPVHALWTGKRELRDVWIAALRHDDLAFVRTVFTIEAEVRAAGYGAGEAVVELERDGKVLSRKSVPLSPSGKTVSFEVSPDRVGDAYYAVVVRPRPDEAILENNRRGFVVRVVRDRIRALHVCGRPSWDERFLRRLLKRDPNIDLISFYILRTVGDLQFVNPGELSLIPFPTDELFEQELGGFDLVILQNFAHAPYGLARHLPRIRDWVERGGGLAVVGGELAFGVGGWTGTPVADVLPLQIPGPGDRRVPGEFRARLREGAEGHPVVRLAASTAATRRAWERLPMLDGANLLGPPIDGGTVLVEHPTERGDDGQPAPVLAVREVGAGRTLVLGTDSAWRWSFLDAGAGGDGRAYDTFWRAAMHWLIRDPDLEQVGLSLPRDTFAPGEAVVMRVLVRDRDFRPAPNVDVTLEVARLDGAGVVPAPALRSDSAGEARVELPSPGPGAFRVTARASIAGRLSQDTRTLMVEPSALELERPQARDDLLRALAGATGGRFLHAGESLADLSFRRSRRVRVESQRDIEILDGLPMLLLALGALGAEWALRRRLGLS